jgi:hypothetical protein
MKSPEGFRPDDLSDEWSVIGWTDARRLRKELRRETVPGHVLHGRPARALAARKLRKESIWWLPQDGAWAVVHLTWTAETDPQWPTTVVVQTWDEEVAEIADWGRA